MSEIVQIRGIGPKYVKLLAAAGIDRATKLLEYEQAAHDLVERLAAVNERAQLVRRLPREDEVGRWIEAARGLFRARLVKAAEDQKAGYSLPGPIVVPPPVEPPEE